MAKKRNKLQIIHDILEVIKDKSGTIKPTHILYKSNLSYQMMDEYLSELIGKEFIVEITLKRGKSYAITTKGRNYLEKYRMIKEFTQSFGLGED
jgi:predicted transcriptional regulator